MNKISKDLISTLESQTDSNKKISGKSLSANLDITEPELRSLVNKLRQEGKPIGSDSDGYFWANNPEELLHTEAQLMSRVKKMLAAVNGLKKAFNQTQYRLEL